MSEQVLVGKLVAGRYRVVRRLGAGGMGTVYVAIQEPLGREVALKVVRRDLSGDERTVERFRREAMTLSQAHHPHIVTLYDFGELDGGALYFAMELVRGENLRQRLIRVGPLPVKKTLAIVRDASSALAAAHALGIIHRDLKPENILLMEAAGRPDFVKIVDFGVAKLVTSDDALEDQEALTQRGSVVGTPGYIAPEVALRGITTDARSDLYALGVVWFECLAGRPPFRSPTATALLMAHALDPVPPLPPEVPLAVAGLVQRLLAKSPEDRPQSAEELSDIIDALPVFDSNTAVPRPGLLGVGTVDSDGPTLEDARASPRPKPLSNPPTHPTEEISAPREVATRSKPDAAQALPVSSSADTKAPVSSRPAWRPQSQPTPSPSPPQSTPAPSPPSPSASPPAPLPAAGGADRRSMIGAAALIAVAIVIAAVAVAVLVRDPHAGQVKVPIDSRDAGTSTAPVGLGDAGSPRADGGAARPRDVVDAGPKKKPHVKKQLPDAGHAPDIYSP